MLCLDRKMHRVKRITERKKLVFKFSRRGGKRQAVFHILPQIVPMCFSACFVHPIFLFLALAVKFAVFQNGQAVFPADLVRHSPQLLVVTDFVLKFAAVLEGHRVHHEMTVNVVRVQVDGDKHLILISPHSPCGFLANGECLLRRNLALLEALNTVVADDLSPQAESPLDGDHLGIGVLLGAVDAAHKYLTVGLVVVFCI